MILLSFISIDLFIFNTFIMILKFVHSSMILLLITPSIFILVFVSNLLPLNLNSISIQLFFISIFKFYLFATYNINQSYYSYFLITFLFLHSFHSLLHLSLTSPLIPISYLLNPILYYFCHYYLLFSMIYF
jgi:hypothetical protein